MPHLQGERVYRRMTVRELSLFSGAGGGLLGTHLLGWTPIGYVEYDDYCQRVIAQRIKDGLLPNAPIFGDVRAFIGEGYASAYQGMADVVTAGWPCQPHSTAGRRKGADDEREGWPWVIETIRQVRPRWFLGENVPGILSTDAGRYFGAILRDLAQAWYQCQWGVLSACAFDAPHARERLFIVAHADGVGGTWRRDSERSISGAQWGKTQKRSQSHIESQRPAQTEIWRKSKTSFLRMADGMGSRMDRIRAIGNGQVPVVVAAAWHLLTEGLDRD